MGTSATAQKVGKEVSCEIHKAAEEQTVQAEPETLEEAAREAVARRNGKDGVSLLEARRRGEVLDRLTGYDVEITADEVRRVTGFGEEDAKLVTKLANQEGKTFTQAVKAVKSAYDAGFTDLKASQASLINPVGQFGDGQFGDGAVFVTILCKL